MRFDRQCRMQCEYLTVSSFEFRASRNITVCVFRGAFHFADSLEATDRISRVPDQRQSLLSASNRMRLLHLLSARILFGAAVSVLSSVGRNHRNVQMEPVHTVYDGRKTTPSYRWQIIITGNTFNFAVSPIVSGDGCRVAHTKFFASATICGGIGWVRLLPRV